MLVKNIDIENFRIIEKISIQLTTPYTVFIGSNGHGKTSILEAVYFLLTNETIRSSRLTDIIRHNESYSKITGDLSTTKTPSQNVKIENKLIKYQNSQKTRKFFLEEGLEKRFSKRKHFLPATFFSPTDIHLFLGSPSRRRRYLDQIASQLVPDYTKVLRAYQQNLSQRNQLLQTDRQPNNSLLNIYNEKLFSYSSSIWKARYLIFQELSQQFSQNIQNYFPLTPRPHLHYKSSWLQIIPPHTSPATWLHQEPHWAKKITTFQQKQTAHDQTKGRTSTGPHLDDFQIWHHNQDFSGQASRGEIRSITIALKQAEIHLLSKLSHQSPVVLLDDIFSELDQNFRKQTEQLLSGYQTLLTATDTKNLSPQLLEQANVFQLLSGKIQLS